MLRYGYGSMPSWQLLSAWQVGKGDRHGYCVHKQSFLLDDNNKILTPDMLIANRNSCIPRTAVHTLGRTVTWIGESQPSAVH